MPLKFLSFSHPSKNGEKIASQSDSEKIAEAPGNKGLPAIPGTPPHGNSGVQPKASKNKKTAAKPTSNKHAPVESVVTATGGPEGYTVDCTNMKPGQLQAAYKRESTSWRNSKSRCKTKGWHWATEWDSFKGFLLSMGPDARPR